MNTERWQRVEELYHAALERTPKERPAFLKEACPDEDLRREVESLVDAESSANSVLDQPAWERRLAAGERLGPYEILEQIGAGGMGEVWKARDTRLDRTVAVKVCAERFSARFEREARAIAALNHPHICTLYDVGPNYLVMEYVEGQPLKGPLPVEKAVEYARQILEGLEAAHARGIVHRDLKPANVLATKSGVKLLDFGLAKMQRPTAAVESQETATVTEEQTIVGTPQYMAPEQIEGKPVDARTDIFAFGCVLHELLTGQQAFAGNSPSSMMAAVLASEPAPVSKLQPATPVEIDRVVSACLAKDPQRRFQTAVDVKRALDWAFEARPQATAMKRRFPWAAVAGVLALACVVVMFGLWRATRPVDRPLVRLRVDLGPDAVSGPASRVAISRDGQRLVYRVLGPDGKQQLATRRLDEAQATLLRGAENGLNPFFSPDGEWVAFNADFRLKKVSIQGGAPVALCTTADAMGGSWGDDGNIVLAPNGGSPLVSLNASGGQMRELTKLADGEATHRWPQILPGGQAVLFTASSRREGMEDATIEVVVLKTGARKVLHRGGYYGRFVPSGHLVYVHQGVLFGVRFDPARLEVQGTPTPLLEDILSMPDNGNGQFDVSQAPSGSGTLLYMAGKGAVPDKTIVWLDSSGKTTTLPAAPGKYAHPRISPDGSRLALTVISKGTDIHVYDLERDTLRRLTFDGRSAAPVWSHDGKHIAFQANSGFGISWVRSDGVGEPKPLISESKDIVFPGSFSPESRWLAYHKTRANKDWGDELWTLPLDITDPDNPRPGKAELFLETPYGPLDNFWPAFSPDGRWIAYRHGNSESGASDTYVHPFPRSGGMWQVSTDRGTLAFWAKNGRELFYESRNRIMVMDYTVNGDSFVPGKTRIWSDRKVPNQPRMNLDMASDGKRLVMLVAPESAAPAPSSMHVTFLLNIFDELRRRIP